MAKTVIKDGDVQVINKDGSAAMTPAAKARVEGILGQVGEDIRNAELGRFYGLRAGIGLIVVKELCEHGEWGEEMVRMIPDRSPRTLRNYMKGAHAFLEDKALLARDIYDKLAAVGGNLLASDTGRRLMLGDGTKADAKASALPKEVLAMADYIRQEKQEKQRSGAAPEEPAKARKVTKAEQLKTARDFWHPVASRIQKAAITDRLWELLPDDELENVQSAMASAAVAMRQELTRRGSKI